MGQGAVGLRHGVQIEEDGPRNMRLLEIGAGVAPVQMPAGVDDPQVGLAQPVRQVFDRDQKAHARARVSWITSVRAERKPASQ